MMNCLQTLLWMGSTCVMRPCAEGSSIVERPALAPKPKLVVRAPIILSVCDDYTIDASGSYGTAGRQLNFSFGVYPNVPNEHVISEMLTRYSEVGTVNVVTIPGRGAYTTGPITLVHFFLSST